MRELIKEFNRENLKPITFIVIVLVLLVVTAYPQRQFGGRVVEIIDGKTAVIETSTGGKLTVVLQFIEIPQPDQPLYQTVKEHLQKLILDKTVAFVPRRILTNASAGQVFLNGIDVSQQMLRDGAAWYALPEKSAQDARESELYQMTEAQAKTEKRGVWGVENMKPAWEFRAEKEELKRQEAKTKLEAIAAQNAAVKQQKVQTVAKPQASSGLEMDMWSTVEQSNASTKSAANGGLLTGTFPGKNIGYVMTSGNFYRLTGGAASKVESRSIYGYSTNPSNNNSIYVIGFFAESAEFLFAESNNLTIFADRQKIDLGKARRFPHRISNAVTELLLYKIDANTLSIIARAKNVEFKLGKFSVKIEDDYQTRIKNLLAATTN